MKCDEILFLTPRELRARSIPNRTTVYITSIVNHKTVFVRPSFASADEFMCQLFDDIDHEGKLNFRPLNELPTCGGIYLVNFEDEFYRVYVLAATSRNHKIDIFFVDFGNIDCVWLCQLSELSDELKQRPILLNIICLAHVPEITFNDNPLRFLNQLCDDEAELTLIVDQKATRGRDRRRESTRTMPKLCHLQFANEVLTVNWKLIRLNSNVFSVDTDECNNNHLFTKCLPIFIYVSAFLPFDFVFVTFSSNAILLQDLTYPWIEDTNVEMQILQNSKIDSFGYLTCIRLDKRVTFDRNMAEIAEYGKHISLNEQNNMHRPR